MIDRKLLGYFTIPLVLLIIGYLIYAKQYIIVSIFSAVYIGLIFGVDKFKIDLKNKKIEIQDEHKD